MIQRTITITLSDEGGWTVAEGGASCPRLCWDEMLGQLVSLTHKGTGTPRYPMLTAGEHEQQECKREERALFWREREATEDAAKRAAIGAMADALKQWASSEFADDGNEFANAQHARDEALLQARNLGVIE